MLLALGLLLWFLSGAVPVVLVVTTEEDLTYRDIAIGSVMSAVLGPFFGAIAIGSWLEDSRFGARVAIRKRGRRS